jgi:hypothetical protein
LKRSYVIAGIFIILASSYLIEYYTNTRFPTQNYPLAGVPELEIGKTKTFLYLRQLEVVGTHSYTVTDKTGGLYTIESNTDVTYQGERIELDNVFVFDELFNPEQYNLFVELGDDYNEIQISFTDGTIVSRIISVNDSVTFSEDFPDGTFLTENNMPGIWEIFLISADFEMGERYTAEVYIPQGGRIFELEFYVNSNPKTLTIDGERISCTVIQETTLDLKFYLYEGELVEMRNDDQDVVFTMTSG